MTTDARAPIATVEPPLEATQPRRSAARAARRREHARPRGAEIKDNVLRMGTLVEEADPARAIARSIAHDADAGPRGHQGDGRHQRGRSARSTAMIAVAHRDPEPGRPRPALPADARPRELRAGADGRPRRVRREAGPQARPGAAARRTTSTCPRWASSVAELVHGDPARAGRRRRGGGARGRGLDDEIDDLYHATSTRSSS